MQVTLFQPAQLMKPLKSGVHSNEFFLIEGFKTLQGKFAVQPKFDGIRVQIHKGPSRGKDVRVVMFSDGYNEIQDRFPGIVDAVKKLPGSILIDGEIIKVEEGVSERHDVVSAYVHSKSPPDDTAFHVEAFDLIYQDGQLDGSPYSERWDKLKNLLGTGDKVHLIDTVISEGGDVLVENIKKVATGEGAMVKDLTSHYEQKYENLWWKWKRQFEVDVRVKEARKTETAGVWVYVCEIAGGLEIGRTYASQIEAKVGDILRVYVDRVAKSAAGKWSWYAPKVYEVRLDKTEPDPASVLDEMLKAIEGGVSAPKFMRFMTGAQLGAFAHPDAIHLGQVVPALRGCGVPGLFVVGGVVDRGFSMHDVDIICRVPLSSDQIKRIHESLSFLREGSIDICIESDGPTGPFVEIIPDGKAVDGPKPGIAAKWVLQRHWWGNKAHFDFRMGNPKGDKMWGWTIFTDPRIKTAKHRTVEKKYHDPRWLTFEGDMQPGEPGNPTTNLIAHMKILESGMYEFGGRKQDFVEVFLKDGAKMNGRFVVRLIQGRPATPAQIDASPAAEGGAKSESIWICWLPIDQTSAFSSKKPASAPAGGGGA